MTLPNFLVIGAERCGTSWLSKHLRSHPSIYMSERRKQIHFFTLYYNRTTDWYQNFFTPAARASKYCWFGEATPGYIYYPEVPLRIKKHIPNCKFIAILRNPADRAYSKYGLHIRNKAEKRAFKEYLDQNPEVFFRGLYYEQLKRYFEYFPLENFLILIFEETMSNPQQALSKIANFLSVDVSPFEQINAKEKINASYRIRFARSYALAHRFATWLRHNDSLYWIFNTAKAAGLRKELFGTRSSIAPIDQNVRKDLLVKYEEDISNLEELLGIDLSIWRK